MPTIHILHHTTKENVAQLLQQVCEGVSDSAGLAPDKVWAFWHPIAPSLAWRADWNGGQQGGPLVRIFCRRGHSREKVQQIVLTVRSILSTGLGCGISTVFVQVLRVDDEEVFNVS